MRKLETMIHFFEKKEEKDETEATALLSLLKNFFLYKSMRRLETKIPKGCVQSNHHFHECTKHKRGQDQIRRGVAMKK